MSDTPDLSKIVNLIMENPALIEEIRSLASTSEKIDAPAESTENAPTESIEANTPPKIADQGRRSRRHELIGAMKPYLSERRGKTVESAMAIADMLDLIRR
jgi:hypothetical protein